MKKDELNNFIKSNKYTVLYFYPKDNTSGCTLEAKNFSCLKQEFDKLWVWIVWISKDSEKSHGNFIQKQELTINLISDENLELHNKYQVLWEKSMYGKKYIWTIRSTFLLNNKCEIVKEWRNVKVNWHTEEVLDYCKKI